MRKVFSSARFENAEAVAKMLEAEGIETRIENGRSFRRGIRGNFSYRDRGNSADNPSVWVLRSDDQPHARQLLRDAGLLEDSAGASRSYLPRTTHASAKHDAELARRRGRRLRLMLLAGVAIVVAGVVFRPTPRPLPQRAAPPPAHATAPADTVISAADAVHRLPTPPALAIEIVRRESASRGAAAVCLAIDGDDPPAATLDVLRAAGITASPGSDCRGEALRIDVNGWRTDGSGSGEVDWTIASGEASPEPHSATAARDGDDWHVDEAP